MLREKERERKRGWVRERANLCLACYLDFSGARGVCVGGGGVHTIIFVCLLVCLLSCFLRERERERERERGGWRKRGRDRGRGAEGEEAEGEEAE